MPQPQRVTTTLTADQTLAEVSRLFQQLKTAASRSQRLAIEAEIRAYSERYWVFENDGGDPIVGKLGGRRRPYLVISK
jgi:post-segregation antitoxin (ccd killing protein)